MRILMESPPDEKIAAGQRNDHSRKAVEHFRRNIFVIDNNDFPRHGDNCHQENHLRMYPVFFQVCFDAFEQFQTGNRTKNLRTAQERARAVATFLTETAAIPSDSIATVIARNNSTGTPRVKVSLIPEQENKP
jgi:hypothetical protein